MATTRDYYQLTKPGIIYGNALPLVAAYSLAAESFDVWRFLAALCGQSLVIAGACVFNNLLDRHIDKRMERTSSRALVTGVIKPHSAFIVAMVCALSGLGILFLGTNITTTLIGLIGLLLYVVVYGWAKRHSRISTGVGAIPGALPPVAGYTAVTGNVDTVAAVLFLILFFWQLPHFYAIARFRNRDYKATGLPIMAAVRHFKAVQIRIMIHIAIFGIISTLLAAVTPLGVSYVVCSLAICAYWLIGGVTHWHDKDAVWSRMMFGRSLMALLVLTGAIAIGKFLP